MDLPFTVLPDSVDSVIDLLDKRFALRSLPVTADPNEIQRMFGARDVVELLRALQKDRDEAALEQLHRHASLNRA